MKKRKNIAAKVKLRNKKGPKLIPGGDHRIIKRPFDGSCHGDALSMEMKIGHHLVAIAAIGGFTF